MDKNLPQCVFPVESLLGMLEGAPITLPCAPNAELTNAGKEWKSAREGDKISRHLLHFNEAV